jgi:hypothetical protein
LAFLASGVVEAIATGHLDSIRCRSFFFGRLIKNLLGGFICLMIVNALPWMEEVLNSFSRVGAAGTISQR